MTEKTASSAVGLTFDIKDYVDATTDAASRTRTVTIILVIATVLIGIGFWNSVKWSWAAERVKAAYDTKYDDKYKLLYSDDHFESSAKKLSLRKIFKSRLSEAMLIMFVLSEYLSLELPLT